MNYFFALEVPPEAQEYVAQVAALWKSTLREHSRWYVAEDYHITLKFLGDVPEDQVLGLVSRGASAAAAVTPFSLAIAPPGVFSAGRSKQILWMGVRRNIEIVSLAETLDQACGTLGYSREQRQYTPHITVTRTERGRDREADRTIPRVDERLFPKWEVERFVLMQTLPLEKCANGSKARYNTVHTFSFGKSQISDVS